MEQADSRERPVMPEQPSATPASAAQVQNSLHELAQVLRQVDHLEPEAQQSLADLVDQLSRTIKPEPACVAEDTHLIAGVASLAQALRQGQSPGLLKAARQQL